MESFVIPLIQMFVAMLVFGLSIFLYNSFGMIGFFAAIFAYYVATNLEFETSYEEDLDLNQALSQSFKEE